MAHLVQRLGNIIAKVRYKINQQMVGCSENLGRISKFEKLSFQMVTERNDAI